MTTPRHLILSLVCFSALEANPIAATSLPDSARFWHYCKNDTSPAWTAYKLEYNKSYADRLENYNRCMSLHLELLRVSAHNMQPDVTYKLHLDFMSDWSESEFEKATGPHRSSKLVKRQTSSEERSSDPFVEQILNRSEPVPSAVDWTKVPNRVGRVKFQLGCGACWAFATTGLLEGQQVARNFSSLLIELSEQQLLDCTGDEFICNRGGEAHQALEMLAEQGGIVGSSEYPYSGHSEGECRAKGKEVVIKVKGFARLPAGDEHKMVKAVARYGPIAASMSLKFLRGYQSGIISGSACGRANHEVLIVGYGSEKGLDYWLVKNSWSPEWGDAGYFKIKRGENVCGIASDSTMATF